MKTKTFSMFVLSMIFVVAVMSFASAATLAQWDLTIDGVASNVDSNVNVGNLNFGSTLTSTSFDSTDGATATGWNIGVLGVNDYYEVTIAPKTGQSVAINSVSFNQISSDSDTDMSFDVEWSKDDFTTSDNIVSGGVSTTTSASSSTTTSITISSGETLTLRIYGYNSDSSSTETFSIKNIVLDGIVTAVTTSSFCSNGKINDNALSLNVDLNNNGEGDDDDWIPLDTIEVEVELDNNKDLSGDGDLNDVVFEIGLFKEGSSRNVADKMIWISKDEEKVKVGDIDEDDSDSHVFEFRVDPSEVSDDNYELRVKAYEKGDEDFTCIDHSVDLADFGSSEEFAKVKVSFENDDSKMVIVDTESYPSVIDAFCGSQTSFTADVYNIGDQDFDDQIKVLLYSKELGVNQETVLSGNFDQGDKDSASFTFSIPQNAEEKTYKLSMETLYDYDKDDDTYGESSDETFPVFVSVSGNCATSGNTGTAKVSATNLESGGNAGEPLVLRATIMNTGNENADFLVNPAGYGEWADSATVVPSTFTLSAGSSKDVIVTLDVKDDASGTKNFNLEVVSNNELATSQPIQVLIEPKKGFFTGAAISSSSAYLWGFGVLNLIVIIAIVIVAFRVLRR